MPSKQGLALGPLAALKTSNSVGTITKREIVRAALHFAKYQCFHCRNAPRETKLNRGKCPTIPTEFEPTNRLQKALFTEEIGWFREIGLGQ